MTELRQNPRIPEKADISVRIEYAPEMKNLEGRVFNSNSVDVSLGGLQMLVEFPVPEGAALELKVTFHESSKTFRHKGLVIWDDELDSQEGKPPIHKVGVQFNTLDNPQFFSWRATISELLDKNPENGAT